MNESACGTVSTADVIATYGGKIVLIERLKFPFGLALPGGHVEMGERPMRAAEREFVEETGLTLSHVQFIAKHVGKRRDPRYLFSKTRVYTGLAFGKIVSEAEHTKVLTYTKAELKKIPKERFAFDHHKILVHYLRS